MERRIRKGLISMVVLFFIVAPNIVPRGIPAKASSNTVIVVKSADELNEQIRAINSDTMHYKGKEISLGADIYYDDTINNFTMIDEFAGTFNGNGHTISGINMSSTSSVLNCDLTMFYQLDNSACVKNLYLKNSSFTQTAYGKDVASIAVENYGILFNVIVSSTNTGTANVVCTSGLVINNHNKILSCGFNGSIKSGPTDAYGTNSSGIADANTENGVIYNSFFNGTINNEEEGYTSDIACIANTNKGVIENVYSAGSVSYNKSDYNHPKAITGDLTGITNNSYSSVLGCYYNHGANFTNFHGFSDENNMKSTATIEELNKNRKKNDGYWLKWSVYPMENKGFPTFVKSYTVNCIKSDFGSLSISDSDKVYYEGDTVTVKAKTIYGYGLSGITVTTSDGKTIAVNAGTKKNTYEFVMPNKNVTITGAFMEQKVTSVRYNSREYYGILGKKITPSLSIKPKSAIIRSATFTSANTNIALAETTGKIKGTGVGTTTITATAADGSGCSDTITIHILPSKVSKVKLSKPGNSINVKWKKVSGASGYGVYKTNKQRGIHRKKDNISKNKTKWVDKTKPVKGKYYYKVRYFVMVDGKKIYSEYTKNKSYRIH